MSARNGAPGTVLRAVALLVALAPAWASAQANADAQRSRLPAAVVKALDANCPGVEIGKLEVEDHAGIKVYDLEFKAGRGEIEVTEDGTVLEVATIVQLKDVPSPAAVVIQKAAGTSSVRDVERSEVRSRIERKDGKARLVPVVPHEYVYEAELANGGEIEVAADGRVIKTPKSPSKESPSKK